MGMRNRWTSLLVVLPMLASGACVQEGLEDDEVLDDTTSMMGTTLESFRVMLSGANERPRPITTDANGSAEFTFNNGWIDYSITVSNLSSQPTAVHIHGPAPDSGTAPPIVTLTLSDSSESGEVARGTITGTTEPGITLDSLKSLMRSGAVYVNVHTKNHPNGEILGIIRVQDGSMGGMRGVDTSTRRDTGGRY